MAKSTQTELYRRIMEVEQLMADGFGRRDICQHGSKNGWNVTNRQIDRYMEVVSKRWIKQHEAEKDRILSTAIKKRERLYLRALKKEDLRTAISIQDSLDKLRGLFVDKVETVNKTDLKIDLSGLSREEVEKLADTVSKTGVV